MRRFRLFANHPIVDFVNTVDGRLRDPEELLESSADLVDWLHEAGIVDAAEAAALRRRCETEPDECRLAFEVAIGLREALWEVLAALAADEPPPESALQPLNRVLALAPRFMQLSATAEGAIASRPIRYAAPLLGHVARLAESGAELLASLERDRLRQCAQPHCAGLFYDTSKSGSRRWCEMRTCGNRAKAARHYRRRASSRARA